MLTWAAASRFAQAAFCAAMYSAGTCSPRHPRRSSKLAKAGVWAVVGSDSLMGRELRELIADAHLPVDLKLIAEDPEQGGILTEQGGEPALILGLEAHTIRDAAVVFL